MERNNSWWGQGGGGCEEGGGKRESRDRGSLAAKGENMTYQHNWSTSYLIFHSVLEACRDSESPFWLLQSV